MKKPCVVCGTKFDPDETDECPNCETTVGSIQCPSCLVWYDNEYDTGCPNCDN